MKMLMFGAAGILSVVAMLAPQSSSTEYMQLPRAPMKREAMKGLVAAGEIKVRGDLDGLYIYVPTPESSAKIKAATNAVLLKHLHELSGDGWRLVCHDADGDGYLLVRG